MIQAFADYNSAADREVYRSAQLTFPCGLKLSLQACTLAGSTTKPNEDAYAVVADDDSLYVGIFDGTTSLKPVAGLKDQTGARFASHFVAGALLDVIELQNPRDIMLALNKRLLAANLSLKGASLEDTHTLPAAGATILRFNNVQQQLELAHVHDAFSILFHDDGSSQLITENRNEQFDSRIFALMQAIAKERGVAPREARQAEEVNQALIARAHPINLMLPAAGG